ncbi:MAG: phosphate ABC transporter permease subunit PstC [Lysobacteraceae bacterium]
MSGAVALRVPRRGGRAGDLVFWWVCGLMAVAGALVVLLIAGFLVGETLPLVAGGGLSRFLTDPGWWPREGSFNVLPMVVASLCLTAGALLVATPLALAYAIVLRFHAPPAVAVTMNAVVEAGAAVPTVIYGLWGLTVLVPVIGAFGPTGATLLTGILVLALMVFPTLSLLARAALDEVPDAYVHAATALAAGRSRVVLGVVVPAARHGILSAMVLAAARAIGETMVVLMVCGNIVQLPDSLLAPVRALTANIALEMPYAVGDHRAALFATGLVMLVLVTTLVAFSEWAGSRGRRMHA